MIRSRLVRQFGYPRGALGWLAGRIMAKRATSIERSLATVALLDVGADDRVLELGHGPGVGLEAALRAAGAVVGIDRSDVMTSMAARRNRVAVGDGRLNLITGDVQTPPDDVGRFDAIFSCNVWLFWDDPVATLAAWRPHLESGGVMAVTFRPPQSGADATEALAVGERIVSALHDAGYVSCRLESIEIGDIPAVCGLGWVADR